MNREIGGYFELELPQKSEYYCGPHVLPVNSGRAALYAAIKASGAKKVYMPHYLCTTMFQSADALGIPYELYFMDENYMPVGLEETGPEEAIVVIQYFGTGHFSRYEPLLKKHHNLIIDNTQAFFAEPLKGAYNLYSPRKFFGVCDGGYLIKEDLPAFELPEDRSSKRAYHMLKRIEEGAHAAYADNLLNEAHFDAFEARSMSPLTQRVLQSIDYEDVQERRKRNFATLHRLLKPYNALDLEGADGRAMTYPFLYEIEGLRAHLVKHTVYVPQWWKDVLDRVPEQSLEAQLTKYLIPLPMDQRYSEEDMGYVAQLVIDYLGGGDAISP